MVQRKELNFEGQNIYIGIDVHLKTCVNPHRIRLLEKAQPAVFRPSAL